MMDEETIQRIIDNNWLKVVEEPDADAMFPWDECEDHGHRVTFSDGLYLHDGVLWVVPNERR
jgi:hypothetical protein